MRNHENHFKPGQKRGQKRFFLPARPIAQARTHWLQPRTVRREPHLPLDTIALVPGTLLPYQKEWQALARSLPAGSVLIITPQADSPLTKALQTIAALLAAEGRRVTRLPAERFGHYTT